MADLNYVYEHMYGVEPFDAVTGGAKVTGQNLIITAWSVTAFDSGPPLSYTLGGLLQPASQNDNLLAQRRVATEQTFHSRVSAQFLAGGMQTSALPDMLMLVLNPPPELRQQWAQSITYTGGNPADLTSYTIKKSQMCGYLWDVVIENTPQSQALLINDEPDSHAFWGTYVDLGDYAGAPEAFLPLLKTSGEDGQQPVQFDVTTPQGVTELIAAVNAGEFYVPLFISQEFSEGVFRVTLKYPHSAARG